MVQIAVLGYGVVGSGTVEVFYKNRESLEKKVGDRMDIKYICDLRDFSGSPYAEKFVKDFNVILGDDDIKVVVEVIGGATFAYDYVKKSLLAGKSVVTSNKELVAKKGAELLAIAKEKNVNFFFEASVGGGIPIIRPLYQCLTADEIDGIAGILNGTTNYILTKMITEGTSFEDALKNAQKLGYAESNPAADVEGHDTCRKICILASLAFGRHVYPDNIHTEGITNITLEDVKYCENFGGAIKLIGWTAKKGDKVAVMVCPAFIKESSQLAGVSDVFNAILVHGDATGDVVFYGRGAGKLPTASAVVSDIVIAARAKGTTNMMTWKDSEQDFVMDRAELENRFYVRVEASGKQEIEKVFGNVEYLTRKGAPENEFAFITSSKQEKLFDNEKAEFEKNGRIIGCIRVLDY